MTTDEMLSSTHTLFSVGYGSPSFNMEYDRLTNSHYSGMTDHVRKLILSLERNAHIKYMDNDFIVVHRFDGTFQIWKSNKEIT